MKREQKGGCAINFIIRLRLTEYMGTAVCIPKLFMPKDIVVLILMSCLNFEVS